MGGSGGITTTVGWAGYSDTSGMIDYSRRKLCFISVELIECFHLAELHITNYWGSCFHSLMTAPVVSHYRHRGICWFRTDWVRAAAQRTDHNSVLLELEIESQLTMDGRYTGQPKIRLTILTSQVESQLVGHTMKHPVGQWQKYPKMYRLHPLRGHSIGLFP